MVQVFFIASDLLRKIKEMFTGITKTTFHSDNAGYYHDLICLCLLLFSNLKIKVKMCVMLNYLSCGKAKNKRNKRCVYCFYFYCVLSMKLLHFIDTCLVRIEQVKKFAIGALQ